MIMETKKRDLRVKPRCPKCGNIISGYGDVFYCTCGFERQKTEWERKYLMDV